MEDYKGQGRSCRRPRHDHSRVRAPAMVDGVLAAYDCSSGRKPRSRDEDKDASVEYRSTTGPAGPSFFFDLATKNRELLEMTSFELGKLL